MEKMLTCVKQAYAIEANATKLSDKMWTHGEVAGIELMIMLSLSKSLARVFAKLGNPDAIRAVNALDDLKRNRGGGAKPSGNNPPDKKDFGNKISIELHHFHVLCALES